MPRRRQLPELLEPPAVDPVLLAKIDLRIVYPGRLEHRGQSFNDPTRLDAVAVVDAGVEGHLVRRLVDQHRGVAAPVFRRPVAGAHVEEIDAVGGSRVKAQNAPVGQAPCSAARERNSCRSRQTTPISGKGAR